MKYIYALKDRLDDSISMHFIGMEGTSDLAVLRLVRAQFKDHFAVKDLTLVSVGRVDDDGNVIGFEPVIIGELYPNSDTIENA